MGWEGKLKWLKSLVYTMDSKKCYIIPDGVKLWILVNKSLGMLFLIIQSIGWHWLIKLL